MIQVSTIAVFCILINCCITSSIMEHEIELEATPLPFFMRLPGQPRVPCTVTCSSVTANLVSLSNSAYSASISSDSLSSSAAAASSSYASATSAYQSAYSTFTNALLSSYSASYLSSLASSSASAASVTASIASSNYQTLSVLEVMVHSVCSATTTLTTSLDLPVCPTGAYRSAAIGSSVFAIAATPTMLLSEIIVTVTPNSLFV